MGDKRNIGKTPKNLDNLKIKRLLEIKRMKKQHDDKIRKHDEEKKI